MVEATIHKGLKKTTIYKALKTPTKNTVVEVIVGKVMGKRH